MQPTRLILVLCTLAASTLPAYGHAASDVPGNDPTSCEHDLEETLLDLDTVQIDFTRSCLDNVYDAGFTHDWMVDRIRRSLRAPYPIPTDGDPRFVLFLPSDDSTDNLIRINFFWMPKSNRIQVSYFSKAKERDSTTYSKAMSYAHIRGVENRFSMTDHMLARMTSDGITLADLDEAVVNPIADVITTLKLEGQIWLVGETSDGLALSIKYVEMLGINYVKDVHVVSENDRHSYLALSGAQRKTADDLLINVERGPFSLHPVRYALGMEDRIFELSGLTRENVVEALELSGKLLDSDDAGVAQHQGAPSRKYLVSQIGSGQYVKIVVAIGPDGDATVLNAHEVPRQKYEKYKSWVLRYGPRR